MDHLRCTGNDLPFNGFIAAAYSGGKGEDDFLHNPYSGELGALKEGERMADHRRGLEAEGDKEWWSSWITLPMCRSGGLRM